MKQMIKPLFLTVPLVAQEFIRAIFPLFLYFLNFVKYYPGNKGIRVGMVCVSPAIKGTFKNKVFFDIQTIKYLNLTVMAGRYAEREVGNRWWKSFSGNY